jgi:hypothetical protein
MVKNQLFRVLPDIEIVHSLLQIFGLSSLHDTNFFTKDTLKSNESVQKLNQLKDTLEIYYLPCKAKTYLQDITEKKCITILRQCIKVHGYTLITKERYIKGSKVSVYRLIENDKETIPKKSEEEPQIVISFK